ncbi:MAG: protein kinase [Nodosilinea sp.]
MPTLCFNLACPQPDNSDDAVVCAACGQPLLLNQRYRGQALIGQGGFGRTYRAMDTQTQPGQVCVIKQTAIATDSLNFQHRSAFYPEAQRQRFYQEAEQLQQLGQHPQIPQLLDVIDNAQGQFLVQDYIPGPNLDQLSPQPLDEAQIYWVLTDILPVLQFIHARQVIHRDVKPANIIAPPGSQPLVLVDFGASKTIDNPALLDKTGTVIGSAGYVAPEQALGKAVFASDIFSLGLTCLHLLTGLHPFDLYSVSEDGWQWQPFLPTPVSPGLVRVLSRMVNRRLKERYASAQDVLADLRWGGALVRLTSPRRPTPAQPPLLSLEKARGTIWQQRFALDLGGVVANQVAVSPSGRVIATACSDGAVRLWNCTNGAPLQSFRKPLGRFGLGHRGSATAVVFGAGGQEVFSGGEDGQLIRWNLADPSLSQRLPLSGWLVSTLLLSPDGQTLVVGTGEGKIYLWDLGSSQPPKTLVHHQDQITALTLNPSAKILISGSGDRTLRLWSLPTGRLVQTLTAPAAKLTALACHPQDGRILSGDSAGRVQVWSPDQAETGQLLTQLAGGTTALALSPDGTWLAIGGEDGRLGLWSLTVNPQGPVQVAELRPGWAVRSLAFTPDSRMLVSTGADETIRFWCPTVQESR